MHTPLLPPNMSRAFSGLHAPNVFGKFFAIRIDSPGEDNQAVPFHDIPGLATRPRKVIFQAFCGECEPENLCLVLQRDMKGATVNTVGTLEYPGFCLWPQKEKKWS